MNELAILITAFGASSPEARKAYEPMDAAVRQAWPQHEVRWAYTSQRVRARMLEAGVTVESPAEALERLRKEGVNQIVMLPLLTVAGEEYNKAAAERCTGIQVEVCRPLLSGVEDIEAICQALSGTIAPGAANILVCHGNKTYDAYNDLLVKLGEAFRRQFGGFAASVEGRPGTEDFARAAELAKKCGRAHFVPFMLVAGEHIQNDVMGDEPESWKSLIGAEQNSCAPSLGRNPAVVQLYLARLQEGIERMEGRENDGR